MTGQTVSHYRVLEKLGEGGMGVVWKAEDLHLKRVVALKFLHASDDLARLLREAQVAASLNHPSICTVYQVDPEHGFLAMEFVEGESLAAKIGGRPLPVDQAVRLAEQICEGLKAAHDKGIIHRDIKSGNVLVTADGRVKILDFGLARAAGQVALTREGAAAGTPGYMAPEQMRGDAVDRRTDIWAMGAVLHEMLAGRLPVGTMAALPQGLDRVVQKALAADPRERYQHVEDLLVDLRRAGAPAPRRLKRRWVLLAAGLALSVLALAGWYLLSSRASGSNWKNATFTQLTNQPGPELFPSLSPDGRSFVFQSRASGNWDIYLQRVGGKNPINLTKDCPEDDTHPAFSPDGERIAFRSERQGGGIFVMGATGESPKRLTDSGYHPAWSPDGQRIVCSSGYVFWVDARPATSYLFVIPAGESAGLRDRRVITAGFADAVQPSWSPSGRRIAFWGIIGGNRDVWTVPAGGGTPVQVTRETATDWNPVWSPDGRSLYFLSDRSGSMNLWRVGIDETSGRVTGTPEQVTTPSTSTFHFSLSRDGRRLAYVNQAETRNINVVGFDPQREVVMGSPLPVTNASWLAMSPDVSPDGKRLAFTNWGTAEDLLVSGVDGSGTRQLTEDKYRDRWPRWSPDGKLLAFYSNRSGTYQIWAISPDGGGLKQLTHLNEFGALYPVWSPDGKRLAFSSSSRPPMIVEFGEAWNQKSVVSLPAMDSLDATLQVSSWSPDGRRLAGFAANKGGISVYSIDSHQYQNFTDFGILPRWLSDNQRLIFFTASAQDSAVYLLDTRSRKTRKILSVAPNGLYGVAPSPDDRRLYFGVGSTVADVWLMSRE